MARLVSLHIYHRGWHHECWSREICNLAWRRVSGWDRWFLWVYFEWGRSRETERKILKRGLRYPLHGALHGEWSRSGDSTAKSFGIFTNIYLQWIWNALALVVSAVLSLWKGGVWKDTHIYQASGSIKNEVSHRLHPTTISWASWLINVNKIISFTIVFILSIL